MKSIKLGIILLFVSLLVACGSNESSAKSSVSEYMNSVINGDQTDKNLATGVEGFINAFEFDYLQTLEHEELKDTYRYTKETFDIVDAEDYDSFESYKLEQKEIFDDYEILQDDELALEMWDGESYKDNYTLLYDVVIANGAGEKVYKKAEFEVEYSRSVWNGDSFEEGFEIIDLTLR